MVNYEKTFYNINSAYIVPETSVASWVSPAETVANTKLYYNNNQSPASNVAPVSPPNLSYPAACTPIQTDGSAKLYKLNATTNRTGLEFMIKVMAGDKIDIFGKSYFLNTATVNNANSTVLDIATLMANMLLSPANAAATKGITSTQLTTINSGQVPGSFFRGANGETTTIPKACINYILFDEQFKYAGGGASRVGTTGQVKDHWYVDAAQLSNIPVTKNGYIFVYVSNESNLDVFFDNLQVIHKPGPILEETHYYPFGLSMSGISSKAAGGLENKKKYNGIEFDNDLDINTYEAYYRNLDPQIGRWWQIDPKCEANINSDAVEDNETILEGLESLTPYNSMGNNPIKHSDPNGDLFGFDNVIGGLVSGLVELGSQVIANAVSGKELTKISWGQVGVAAGEGFLTSGASTVTKLVVKGLAAVGSSAIDYVESGHKINSLKDVGNVAKNAAIGVVADKATGAVAKLAKGVGGKTLQNVSNKIIGSKNQITKNILANNVVSTKTAGAIAKIAQSAQKDVAKAVRETNIKVAETGTKGLTNPAVNTLKEKTNL